MEPKFQTSFIPKKPIVSGEGTVVGVVRSTSLMSTVAWVVFIVTLISVVGLFVFKGVLEKQIDSAGDSVDQARVALKPETIQLLVDADSRITSAQKLLNEHITVSKLLIKIQELTVKRMRLDELEYKKVDSTHSLNFKGEIQTYNALAQQQNIFSDNEFFLNPEFTAFDLVDNGYIRVNFSSGIDPEEISYKRSVDSLEIN